MAKTVTIQSLTTDKDQYGKEKFLLKYIEDGTDTERTVHIFSNSAIFDFVQKHKKRFTKEKKVDLSFTKREGSKFWDLDKIAEAGSLNTAESRSNFRSKAQNPDRELSMEVSGIMQAIIAHDGIAGLEEKTTKVFLLKQELMQRIKDGTLEASMDPLPATAEALEEEEELHNERTNAVVSYDIDDDDAPF